MGHYGKLRYIDLCIENNQEVQFEFMHETEIGFILKVWVDGNDMGEIELDINEITYYTQGLWEE